MTHIIVKDLDMSKDLDKKAMRELVGGSRNGNGFKSNAWKTKQSTLLKNTAQSFRK